MLIAMLAACSTVPAPPGEVAESNVARDTAPEVDSTTLASLTRSNQAFAFDLYGELANGGTDNLFVSPHSISVAFAMAFAGAEGETATEMSETLRYDLSEPDLHEAFNALDLELAARAQVEGRGDGFELSILNQPFGQVGFGFEPPYLDTLGLNYGAGLRLLDFESEPEASRVAINDWVLDATRNRIEDLLPPGSLTPLTRLVLTNAIYFNASWAEPFQEGATSPEPFTLLDGSNASVDTMRGTMDGTFATGDGWRLAEVPYLGGEVVMGLLVPDEGRFAEIEGGLDGAFVDGALDQLRPASVNLALPKFSFESETSLKASLQALGMSDPFSDAADFSGITTEAALYISDAFHKAFITVDEEGTEAAAATAIVFNVLSAGPEMVELTVDRPFVFWIRDRPTGAMLFVGRVTDPS